MDILRRHEINTAEVCECAMVAVNALAYEDVGNLSYFGDIGACEGLNLN